MTLNDQSLEHIIYFVQTEKIGKTSEPFFVFVCLCVCLCAFVCVCGSEYFTAWCPRLNRQGLSYRDTSQNPPVVRFEGEDGYLSAGERGYRESMKYLFTEVRTNTRAWFGGRSHVHYTAHFTTHCMTHFMTHFTAHCTDNLKSDCKPNPFSPSS